MSKIFHQFLTGGCKANVLAHNGKFLSMLKNHQFILPKQDYNTFRQSVTGGF